MYISPYLATSYLLIIPPSLSIILPESQSSKFVTKAEQSTFNHHHHDGHHHHHHQHDSHRPQRLGCVACRASPTFPRPIFFSRPTWRQQVDIRKPEEGDTEREIGDWSISKMGFLGCQVCDNDSKAEEESRRSRSRATTSTTRNNMDCNVCAPHPCTLDPTNKRSKSAEVRTISRHPPTSSWSSHSCYWSIK